MTTNGAGASSVHANAPLSIIGRAELENMVVRLRSEVKQARLQEEEARQVAARAETARAIMEKTLAATQAHCTLQLEELRVCRQNAFVDLARALDRARAKHPKGSRFSSLVEETGEVARAMRREGLERVREELLDTAVVAMRLYLGETREPLTEERGKLEQSQ